jgi:hypothetical protein
MPKDVKWRRIGDERRGLRCGWAVRAACGQASHATSRTTGSVGLPSRTGFRWRRRRRPPNHTGNRAFHLRWRGVTNLREETAACPRPADCRRRVLVTEGSTPRWPGLPHRGNSTRSDQRERGRPSAAGELGARDRRSGRLTASRAPGTRRVIVATATRAGGRPAASPLREAVVRRALALHKARTCEDALVDERPKAPIANGSADAEPRHDLLRADRADNHRPTPRPTDRDR